MWWLDTHEALKKIEAEKARRRTSGMSMPERRERLTAMMRELIAEMQCCVREIDYEDHLAKERYEAEKERDALRKNFSKDQELIQISTSMYMIAKDALKLIVANPADALAIAEEGLRQAHEFKPGKSPWLKDNLGRKWLLEE